MWCGIGAVSAAMGRNSWLKAGPFTVFPNLFIVLVAGSGKCRKSTAINAAEELIRLMSPQPNLIAQKLSPEALIQAIRRVETKDMTKLLAEECTGFVVADELATFLNKKTYEAGLASLLISMYDCKTNFQYRTISRGVEDVNNACLGMLAGSTVDWIRSGVPEEAVGGGLTSRILFIYVDTPAPPVAFPEYTEAHARLKDRLVRQLDAISKIRGDFSMSPAAMMVYKAEYDSWRGDEARGIKGTGDSFYKDRALEGYASRRHMQLLKLSLILSACESTDKIIKDKHIFAAAAMLGDNEKFLKLVLSLITSSQHGSAIGDVLGYIRRHGRVTRSDLIKAMSNKMKARELNEIVDTLLAGDQVVVTVTPQGTFYIINPQAGS
jgi:hypothetical protein